MDLNDPRAVAIKLPQRKPQPELVLIPVELRDYFAGQALIGMLANKETRIQGAGVPSCDAFAEQAYAFADAMLKAREQS